MRTEPSTLSNSARAIVNDMLARLRTLIESSQERSNQLTSDLRQVERNLDEVSMQRQFAVERHLPTAENLTTREQSLRASHRELTKESQDIQRSMKQLDQLIRQVDMSSATLDGTNEGEKADPWMQALRAQVILGREEERVRLAREVHDSPAQVLANTLIGLEKSRSLLHEQRMDHLQQLLDRLCGATRDGLQEVRQFIADLRPGQLDEKGLTGALQDYIQRYQDSYNSQVSFETDSLPRLSREAEIVLYRVVQESLQNAHKHARGAPVHVVITMQKNKLTLTVRDEGPGFDPREVARRAGRKNWGLTSMRERAELVGASYKVTSRQGQGTEVMMILPLP
jgi:two-component system, NarL family, sensor histidine kinase DegS